MPTITFAAAVENLGKVLDQVRHYAQQHHFSEDQQSEIELALEEVIVNIIDHGYPASATGEIELAYRCSAKGTLLIRIADQAPRYNPLQNIDPDRRVLLADRAEGGLGIFLCKKMMDKICYRYENEKNVLTLVKFRQ